MALPTVRPCDGPSARWGPIVEQEVAGIHEFGERLTRGGTATTSAKKTVSDKSALTVLASTPLEGAKFTAGGH
jgi:hypothetical protein